MNTVQTDLQSTYNSKTKSISSMNGIFVPSQDGMVGWIRAFGSVLFWFGLWGILDIIFEKIVQNRLVAFIALGFVLVFGMVFILVTNHVIEGSINQ